MGALNAAGPASAIADSEARKDAVLAGELDSESSKPIPNENQGNGANGFYVASDIKRFRRTKSAIAEKSERELLTRWAEVVKGGA